jgi:hypothetical protein
MIASGEGTMRDEVRAWMTCRRAAGLIAILCAALGAPGCRENEPLADAAPQEKPPATAPSPNAAPKATPAAPSPWFSESIRTPAAHPDAAPIPLSAVEEELAKQVGTLQREGRLEEIRGSFGPRGGLDTRVWLYHGRLVKLEREALFVRPASLELPEPEEVREIAVRYSDRWGERAVTDRREIELWLEALAAGSAIRERVLDTVYYPDGYTGVGATITLGAARNELAFTTGPSHLVFGVKDRPPLVVQVFFEGLLSEGWVPPAPGSPLVEKVESYRLERADGRPVSFENPLLDVLVEKHFLEITRELGLTNGEVR